MHPCGVGYRKKISSNNTLQKLVIIVNKILVIITYKY